MQHESDPDLVAKLDSLEALLDAQTKGVDEGLALISGKTDSYAVRRRLAILLNAERYEEAAAVARELPPHPEWVDKGVMSLARCGDTQKARELIAWASKSI